MLNVEVIPAREMDEEHFSTWRRIQSGDSTLSSPFFCPEFTALAGAVRRDVSAGQMKEGSRVVGFFPFERRARSHAIPVGGPLSDYQGLIVEPDSRWDPEQLLRQCGLRSWKFNHLISSQQPFSAYRAFETESPIIDLSQGVERYNQQRQAGSSKQYKTIERQRRVLARDIGPLRFEPQVRDLGVLHTLLGWKSEQYRRTGGIDPFAFSWTRELLERIHATQSDSFSGVLSALYAGDTLVAAHMGMRSRETLHYWFPSYDDQFRKYSPGLTLLLEMIEAASTSGVQTVDLGRGDATYKRHFSNGAVAISEGAVSLPSFERSVQELAGRVADLVRRTPLAVPARLSARLLRRYRHWLELR